MAASFDPTELRGLRAFLETLPTSSMLRRTVEAALTSAGGAQGGANASTALPSLPSTGGASSSSSSLSPEPPATHPAASGSAPALSELAAAVARAQRSQGGEAITTNSDWTPPRGPGDCLALAVHTLVRRFGAQSAAAAAAATSSSGLGELVSDSRHPLSSQFDAPAFVATTKEPHGPVIPGFASALVLRDLPAARLAPARWQVNNGDSNGGGGGGGGGADGGRRLVQ